jgi:hypothetical protein
MTAARRLSNFSTRDLQSNEISEREREYRISLTIEPHKAKSRRFSGNPTIVNYSIASEEIPQISHFGFWWKVS